MKALLFLVVFLAGVPILGAEEVKNTIPEEFGFSDELPVGLPDISKWENTWAEVELCPNGKFDPLRLILDGVHPLEAIRTGIEACPDEAEASRVLLVVRYAFYVDPASPMKYTMFRFGFRGVKTSYLVWRADMDTRKAKVFVAQPGQGWQDYAADGQNFQKINDAATWMNALHSQVRYEQEHGTLMPVR